MTQIAIPRTLDLADAALFQNEEAHDVLKYLRHNDPVHWNEGEGDYNGFWSITKYDDILHISRHPERYISSKGIAGPGLTAEAFQRLTGTNPDLAAQTAQQGSVSIITMDPPRHVQMRRLVNKGFTPRAVTVMEPTIRKVANDILDKIAGQSGCDFVTEVASQLPLAVICGLMGLEEKDWPLMFDLTNRVLGAGDPEYQTEVDAEPGSIEAARKTAGIGRMRMIQFFGEQLALRRAHPGDDIISLLLESEIDGEKISEFEILAFCFLLILAGNETTRNAISGGMLVLSQNPREKQRLLNDMSLIDSAVEEIVRWTSPLHHMARAAVEDDVIGGKQIKAGDRVLMWYPSANRDEDYFIDPYKFDITRSPNEHLAFGIGEHFCLGAGFAKKEIKVMFEELFRRFPDIEVSAPPERLLSNFLNGIKHLPVTFTPERA